MAIDLGEAEPLEEVIALMVSRYTALTPDSLARAIR